MGIQKIDLLSKALGNPSLRRRNPQLFNTGNASNPPGDKGDRSLPVIQEQQGGGGKKAVHKARIQAVDGQVHPKFGITAFIRNSDGYRRDPDGQFATILDCLVRAVRRLKERNIK